MPSLKSLLRISSLVCFSFASTHLQALELVAKDIDDNKLEVAFTESIRGQSSFHIPEVGNVNLDVRTDSIVFKSSKKSKLLIVGIYFDVASTSDNFLYKNRFYLEVETGKVEMDWSRMTFSMPNVSVREIMVADNYSIARMKVDNIISNVLLENVILEQLKGLNISFDYERGLLLNSHTSYVLKSLSDNVVLSPL